MLHPDQFEINEAWVAVKLNDAPVSTDKDGLFDCIALIDAASSFILTTQLVPVRDGGLSKIEARRLLKNASSHKKQLPKTLFIARQQSADNLVIEAERQKVTAVRVAEDQLVVLVTEAVEGFREYLSGAKPL